MADPVLAVATSFGRFYAHPLTGQRVPSVTNVIGCLDKPALVPWAAKMAAEYADRQWTVLTELGSEERITLIKSAHRRESERAMGLGTAVHDAIDHWCRDEPMPEWQPGVASHMDQFVEFLEQRSPEFLANEFTVWNGTVGYAGTADFLAVINGRTTLVDVKTGKGVYPEAGLQLAALANAECIMLPDGSEAELPQVDIAAVLHVRPRSWALVPIADLDGCWEGFRSAVGVARWVHECKPSVLGARLGGR